MKIDQHYRVRLILDNLPITTYDLEDLPESIRPGFQVHLSPVTLYPHPHPPAPLSPNQKRGM